MRRRGANNAVRSNLGGDAHHCGAGISVPGSNHGLTLVLEVLGALEADPSPMAIQAYCVVDRNHVFPSFLLRPSPGR